MTNIQNFITFLEDDSPNNELFQLSVYPVEGYWVAIVVAADAPDMPIYDPLNGEVHIYAKAQTMKEAIEKLEKICSENMF